MANILMLTPDDEEIDVPEEHFDTAINKDKFEPALEYVDPKTGSDVVVRKSHLKSAEKNGLKPKVVYEAEKANQRKIGVPEAAARGLANWGTVGASDEIGGAVNAPLGAIKSLAGLVGKDMSDDEDVKNYKLSRDSYRKDDDEAWKTQKLAYGAGAAVPAALSLLNPASNAVKGLSLGKSVLSSAGQGALGAAGGGTDVEGQADLTKGEIGKLLEQLGIGTVVGGAAGGALHAATPYVAKAGQKVADTVGGAIDSLKNAGKTFYSGAETAAKNVDSSIPGIKQVRQLWEGLKGGKNAVAQGNELSSDLNTLISSVTKKTDAELAAQKIAEQQAKLQSSEAQKLNPTPPNPLDELNVSKMLGMTPKEEANYNRMFPSKKPSVPQEPVPIAKADASTEMPPKALSEILPETAAPIPEEKIEYPLLGSDFFLPGESETKNYVANKATTLAPGNFTTDELKKLFGMGVSERVHARNFDPSAAAKEIAPELKEALSKLKKGKGGAFEKLQRKAEKEFNPIVAEDLLPNIYDRVYQAGRQKGVPDTVKGTLAQVQQIVEEGIANKQYGIQEGILDAGHNPIDYYKRIQAAREAVDGPLKAAINSGDRTSAGYLKATRDELDNILKSSKSKKLADSIYAEGSKAKEKFFSPFEFGPKGAKELDAVSVEKLFGNNDKAKRIQEGVETMRNFLKKNAKKLDSKSVAEMSRVVDKFDQLRELADKKRFTSNTRFKQGPTSPAIERAESLLSKEGLDKNIFASPATTLNSADEFLANAAKDNFQMPFEKLDTPQRNKLIRMLLYRQQNPDSTRAAEQSAFSKILGSKN